ASRQSADERRGLSAGFPHSAWDAAFVTRWRLLLEYDGGAFAGWQRQENAPSVQAALEEAVLAFSGERVLVQGAGRTDAGVHATGQVAHLDLERQTSGDTLRDAVNFHLRPQPVAVLAAEAVSPDLHARFSAQGRRYLYRLLDRRAPAGAAAGGRAGARQRAPAGG